MDLIKYQLFLLLLLTSCQLHAAQLDSSNSCSTNFFLLEKSLLHSTDNRFNLLKAFYPPREARPVLVKVNYTFTNVTSDNVSQIWFWSESEFYLIQPLEIFQFTSLLFSNMPYRRADLSIQLPSECSLASEEYLQLLTTRLKLYAQSPTTGPDSITQRLNDGYVAVAASLEQVSRDTLQSDFVKVWLHMILIVFPLATWLLLYLCDPIQLLLGDKTWTKLEDEHSHGTVAALIEIGVVFTVYVFILDIIGIYFTITSDIISFDSNSAFYLSTVTGLLIDVGAFAWVIFVLASSCHWDFRNLWKRMKNKEMGDTCAIPNRIKKLLSTVTIAPLLCLANHLHYIIIAFISDPFHAGSMAIVYTIAFFLFIFIFRQFYNRMVLHSNKRPKVVSRLEICQKCLAKENVWDRTLKNRNSSTTPLIEQSSREESGDRGDKCNCFIPGPDCHTPFNTQVLVLSLLTVGPLVIFYLGIMIILFFSLPITKSIEDAPSTIYTIYQGTGLIIVALLTYNIILNPAPFSINRTLERLAKRLHLPDTTNYWNRLSDEEKFSKIIVTLLESFSPKLGPASTSSIEKGVKMNSLEREGEDIDNKDIAGQAVVCAESSV